MTAQSSTGESSANRTDFGANEWLVEEMYERYLADPQAVDAAWHDFFDDYQPSVGPISGSSLPATVPAASNGHHTAENDAAESTSAENYAAGNGTTAPSTVPASSAQPQVEPTVQPATAAPTTTPANPAPANPVSAKPSSDGGPAWAHPAVAPTGGAGAITTLRGAPAKVVQNMQASLEITRIYYRNTDQTAMHFAEHLADGIGKRMSRPDSFPLQMPEWIAAYLDQQRDLLALDAIEFYPEALEERVVSQRGVQSATGMFLAWARRKKTSPTMATRLASTGAHM